MKRITIMVMALLSHGFVNGCDQTVKRLDHIDWGNIAISNQLALLPQEIVVNDAYLQVMLTEIQNNPAQTKQDNCLKSLQCHLCAHIIKSGQQ